ncbi:MAG: hypothetical protein WA823_09610 [Candidatus Acidiferrales bacterium]
MRTRPVGITILAILGFLSVAFYAGLTVFSLVNPAGADNLLQNLSGGGAGPAALQRLAGFLPVYFIVTGAVCAAMSWGLWTLKNWARVLCLVLIGLSLIGGAIGIAGAWSHSSLAATTSALVRMVIAMLIFVYLSSAGVRSAFRRESVPVA